MYSRQNEQKTLLAISSIIWIIMNLVVEHEFPVCRRSVCPAEDDEGDYEKRLAANESEQTYAQILPVGGIGDYSRAEQHGYDERERRACKDILEFEEKFFLLCIGNLFQNIVIFQSKLSPSRL